MYIIINDEDEIFRDCTYPGVKPNVYKISNYGRVYSSLTNKYLTAYSDTKGYLRVVLSREHARPSNFKIHRLVAWEFNHDDKRDIKNQPNHLDGIRSHNFYKNIPWSTAKDNVRHSFEHGNRTSKSGEDHYRNKYSLNIVETIRDKISSGMTNIQILQNLGYQQVNDNKLLYNLIVDIRRGKVWKEKR